MRKRIKDIVNIQIGYQFRQSLNISSDGQYQVIQAKDINASNHQLEADLLNNVTPKRNPKRYEVANGDVIFLSKGRRNYATFIEGLSGVLPAIVAGYFFILQIKSKSILPEYLSWSINQQPAQAYLQRVARGSGMPFIPKDAFSNLEIDVPPIEVQELIVRLHNLSLQEERLLTTIKTKRNELLQGICLKAAKTKNRS